MGMEQDWKRGAGEECEKEFLFDDQIESFYEHMLKGRKDASGFVVILRLLSGLEA